MENEIKQHIKLLLVEDSENDVFLTLYELERFGYKIYYKNPA